MAFSFENNKNPNECGLVRDGLRNKSERRKKDTYEHTATLLLSYAHRTYVCRKNPSLAYVGGGGFSPLIFVDSLLARQNKTENNKIGFGGINTTLRRMRNPGIISTESLLNKRGVFSRLLHLNL